MGFLNRDIRYKTSLPKNQANSSFGSDYIGIEFECEDINGSIPRGNWQTKGDGSLRNGVEFTLGPVLGDGIESGIDLFFEHITFNISPRTGLHIHLDMTQDEDTWQRVRGMFLGYYIFEEVFFNIAGQYRKSLGYSNPLEMSTNLLVNVVRANDPRSLEYICGLNKYNAFNTRSLSNHGTIEFRHMPMVKTKDEVVNWIKFLLAFKREIYAFGSEADILEHLIDKESCDEFINRVLSSTNYTLSGVYDFENCLSRLATIDSLKEGPIQETSPTQRPAQRPDYLNTSAALAWVDILNSTTESRLSEARLDAVNSILRGDR